MNLNQVWWYTPMIPALWKAEMEEGKFELILDNVMTVCLKRGRNVAQCQVPVPSPKSILKEIIYKLRYIPCLCTCVSWWGEGGWGGTGASLMGLSQVRQAQDGRVTAPLLTVSWDKVSPNCQAGLEDVILLTLLFLLPSNWNYRYVCGITALC